MKKILSIAVLLVVMYTSCKKDDTTAVATTTHTIKVVSSGFGAATYTVTLSYIPKGSNTPVILEKKDWAGAVTNYTYSVDLKTGDKFSLDITSNSSATVLYTVTDGSIQLVQKRADNIRADQTINFNYVIPN